MKLTKTRSSTEQALIGSMGLVVDYYSNEAFMLRHIRDNVADLSDFRLLRLLFDVAQGKFTGPCIC